MLFALAITWHKNYPFHLTYVCTVPCKVIGVIVTKIMQLISRAISLHYQQNNSRIKTKKFLYALSTYLFSLLPQNFEVFTTRNNSELSSLDFVINRFFMKCLTLMTCILLGIARCILILICQVLCGPNARTFNVKFSASNNMFCKATGCLAQLT